MGTFFGGSWPYEELTKAVLRREIDNFVDMEEEEKPVSAEMIALLTLLSLFTIIGSVGNGLVLFVFSRVREKTTAQLFILALALIDLFTCMVIIPFTMFVEFTRYDIKYDFLCKLYQFLITSKVPLSAFVMVAIAFDRYFCICHPLKRLITPWRTKVIIVCLTLFASLLGVITSLGFGVYQVFFRPDPAKFMLLLQGNVSQVLGTATTLKKWDIFGDDPLTNSDIANTVETRLKEYLASHNISTPITSDRDQTDGIRTLVYIGVCAPNEILLHWDFLSLYQKCYTALFLVCLVIVGILYGMIYRFIGLRRSRKLKQRLILCNYINGDNGCGEGGTRSTYLNGNGNNGTDKDDDLRNACNVNGLDSGGMYSRGCTSATNDAAVPAKATCSLRSKPASMTSGSSKGSEETCDSGQSDRHLDSRLALCRTRGSKDSDASWRISGRSHDSGDSSSYSASRQAAKCIGLDAADDSSGTTALEMRPIEKFDHRRSHHGDDQLSAGEQPQDTNLMNGHKRCERFQVERRRSSLSAKEGVKGQRVAFNNDLERPEKKSFFDIPEKPQNAKPYLETAIGEECASFHSKSYPSSRSLAARHTSSLIDLNSRQINENPPKLPSPTAEGWKPANTFVDLPNGFSGCNCDGRNPRPIKSSLSMDVATYPNTKTMSFVQIHQSNSPKGYRSSTHHDSGSEHSIFENSVYPHSPMHQSPRNLHRGYSWTDPGLDTVDDSKMPLLEVTTSLCTNSSGTDSVCTNNRYSKVIKGPQTDDCSQPLLKDKSEFDRQNSPPGTDIHHGRLDSDDFEKGAWMVDGLSLNSGESQYTFVHTGDDDAHSHQENQQQQQQQNNNQALSALTPRTIKYTNNFEVSTSPSVKRHSSEKLKRCTSNNEHNKPFSAKSHRRHTLESSKRLSKDSSSETKPDTTQMPKTDSAPRRPQTENTTRKRRWQNFRFKNSSIKSSYCRNNCSGGSSKISTASSRSFDADRLREENRAANARTALMLFTVTLVFVVAFLPAWLMAHRIVPSHLLVFYLYFTYNVANPFIYAFMNVIFKDHLRKILGCARRA